MLPRTLASSYAVSSYPLCNSSTAFPTDRQHFARNSACRFRFWAFNPRFEHHRAENRPKLRLSVLVLYLCHPADSASTPVLGTDRPFFARNSACRSRIRTINPRFEHRQTLKQPKLRLSVRSPCAGGVISATPDSGGSGTR